MANVPELSEQAGGNEGEVKARGKDGGGGACGTGGGAGGLTKVTCLSK